MIRRRAVLLGMVIAGGTAAASATAGEKDRPKSKKKDAEYALLFGTVFDESGRSARGVKVRVRQKDGNRKWEAVTDPRGEFALQLPAGAAVYVTEAAADGFSSESREISFAGDERQDISLRLARKK